MKETVGEVLSIKKSRRCHGCVCCLPPELLAIILSHLSVLDYIYFRAVSKCWLEAFSNCSKIIFRDEACRPPPWFLILSSKQPKRPIAPYPVSKPLLYTTGKFGDLSTGRIYTTCIPELCGTRMLLSRHGWLLLFSSERKSQLFFFSVFSRAKISLPSLDVDGLDKPVFGMSAPPTSPDCVVFVISCHSSCGYEISLCGRTDESWRTIRACDWEDNGPVVNVFFINRMWYCLHHSGDLSTFDAVSFKLKFLDKLIKPTWIGIQKNVSYALKHRGKVFLRLHGDRSFEIALNVPPKAYMNGLLDEATLRADSKRAILKLHKNLAMDSFSADAWCGTYNSDGSMNVWWHKFESYADRLCKPGIICNSCLHNSQECSANIMWFEPSWVDSSQGISWVL